MYDTLLAKIQTTLDATTGVEDAFNYPKTKFTAFPAVYFQPDGMSNSFETTTENYKVYRFLMMVIIGIEGSDEETVFGTVLPATVDNIIAQFDTEWDQGTVNGHRVWAKIDSADAWAISEEQDGRMAYAPLSLEIRVLTDT